MLLRSNIILACLAALLASNLPALSDTFNWSYTGAPCTTAICGFGPDIFPPQAMTGSGTLTTGAQVSAHGHLGFLVTGITGTWNGFTITGLLPTDPSSPFFFFNDNVVFYPDVGAATVRFLDIEGLGFSVSDGTGVNLFWDNPFYFAFASATPPYGFTDFTGGSYGTFTLAAVPGPVAGAGLPGLILAGGAFIGWWRRKQQKVIDTGNS
jgi:hypothetical protein